MFKNLNLIFIVFFIFCGLRSAGQISSLLVRADKLIIDALDPLYQGIGPGDTLFFNSGSRDFLLIKNFIGEKGKPIVMMNYGGDVIIDTDHYFGISIQNCRYLKFSGTGYPKQTYGFKIKRVSNGAGIGIGALSSDFELDHISIENTMIAGIYAKTDPDCTLTSVRGIFTQYNTIIHDNYISNTGNEGLYVGSTQYFGQNVKCDGKDMLLMPGLLDGVKIYNNIIKYPGWDGIQVSSASDNCQIYNNTILFDSQSEVSSQMSGILIGGGTRCDCFNNFISQGKGDGIEIHGLGGCRVFNNIIVDPGQSFLPSDKTQMKHGIFVSDVSVQNDSSFYIQNNDIINPKSDAIRFSSIKSKKSQITANVLINPGNFDYYEKGMTRFKGKDSYIMFQNIESDVIMNNNYSTLDIGDARFLSTLGRLPDDFKIGTDSPLVDKADVDKNIGFDFAGTPRPSGLKSDIGAFELDTKTFAIVPSNSFPEQIKLLQNPADNYLIFSLPKVSNAKNLLSIYSLNGKMIIQIKEWEYAAENLIIQANISDIKQGIYIYTIHSGDYASSGKFIKR